MLKMPLIYLMSSLSSIASIALAMMALAILNFRMIQKNLIKVAFSTLAFLGFTGLIFFAVNSFLKKDDGSSFEGLSIKAHYIYEAAFCKGPCWQNWSYRGRVVSNLKPLEMWAANPMTLIWGDTSASEYQKIESTWASLAINWGFIFAILYLSWIIFQLRFVWRNRQDQLWSLIVLASVFFLVFNVILYRFPVNILLYAGLAFLSSSVASHAKKSP